MAQHTRDRAVARAQGAMKPLFSVLALSAALIAASCAQTPRNDTRANAQTGAEPLDRGGAGSSAPGGRADGKPGSYGPALLRR